MLLNNRLNTYVCSVIANTIYKLCYNSRSIHVGMFTAESLLTITKYILHNLVAHILQTQDVANL